MRVSPKILQFTLAVFLHNASIAPAIVHHTYCGTQSIADHDALLQACGVGDAAAVEEILIKLHESRKTEECYAHKGPTPLMAAAHAGAVDVVKLLLPATQDSRLASAVVNVVEEAGADDLDNNQKTPNTPWLKLNSGHYALDGWFAQATQSYALFDKPWGPALDSVIVQHDRHVQRLR